MNPIPEEMSHSNDLVESVGQGERMGSIWEKQRADALRFTTAELNWLSESFKEEK